MLLFSTLLFSSWIKKKKKGQWTQNSVFKSDLQINSLVDVLLCHQIKSK